MAAPGTRKYLFGECPKFNGEMLIRRLKNIYASTKIAIIIKKGKLTCEGPVQFIFSNEALIT